MSPDELPDAPPGRGRDEERGARPQRDVQQRLEALARSMLELHRSLALAKTAHEKTVIQRQIDATDRQIDQLVYELYGLTEEEIAIVEQGAVNRERKS